MVTNHLYDKVFLFAKELAALSVEEGVIHG